MLAQVTGWRSPRTSDAQTPLASPECRFAPDAALCRRAPRPANQAPTLAIFASAASTRAAASAAKPTLLAMVRSGQLAGVTGIGVIRQRSESALTIWRCWSGPLLISITPVAGGSLFLSHDRDRQLVDLAGDSLGDRAGAPGARLVPSCVTQDQPFAPFGQLVVFRRRAEPRGWPQGLRGPGAIQATERVPGMPSRPSV